jgi:hypothetical protein
MSPHRFAHRRSRNATVLRVVTVTAVLLASVPDAADAATPGAPKTQVGSRLERRGVNYDLGVWSPPWVGSVVPPLPFSLERTRREIAIIKNDLHCNAIKITGHEPEDLVAAARLALEQKLEVWLTPHLIDKTEQETLEYTVDIARRAEALRHANSNLILVVGVEHTLFMKGILDLQGDTFMDRLNHPDFGRVVSSGRHNARLNACLARVTSAVREVFHGSLTYGSIPGLEKVDWDLFDFVGLDHYREAGNRARYAKTLGEYQRFKKPIVVLETGVCTYRGAEELGPNAAFAILDQSTGLVKADLVRDEAMQARELVNILEELAPAGVEGIFVYTFVQPYMPHHESDIRYDFDLGSFGLVKSYVQRNGMTYPDVPWEPKAAFYAVAGFYSRYE